MENQSFEKFHYKIVLKGSKISKISDISDNQFNHFDKKIQTKIPKIYAIKHKNDIVYVGQCITKFSAKMNSGLSSNGTNGYHGYKWKYLENIEIFVFAFDDLNKFELTDIGNKYVTKYLENQELKNNLDQNTKKKKAKQPKSKNEKEIELKLENIEAELVFKIKQETGIWTMYQNEIHFNNFLSEGKDIAIQIYNQLIINTL